MSTARWMLLPVVLSLAGCGTDEFQDLQDFVKSSGADMRGKIEAPPEVKPYEPFTYNNSEGLPDPFKSRKAEQPGPAPGPAQVQTHPPEELESFPLENLKMVGYLYIHETPYAVIQAPDGKIHHVRVGNYMGQNYGKITSITETEVKLTEKVLDSNNELTDRTTTLQLVE